MPGGKYNKAHAIIRKKKKKSISKLSVGWSGGKQENEPGSPALSDFVPCDVSLGRYRVPIRFQHLDDYHHLDAFVRAADRPQWLCGNQ